MREKLVQTSDEKFLRQPSRRLKITPKTLKFQNISPRPTEGCLFPMLENALVDRPKLDVKFKPISWQDFVTFGDQGWITNQYLY
jgi:hypothetical protein